MNHDTQYIMKSIKEVLYLAGEFISSHVDHIQSIEYKKGSFSNLVTDVDKEAENIVKETLKKNFPDFGFLCEESVAIDIKSDYKWIIDPIDGTTNFTHSLPFFCTSIALEYKGNIIAGGIYDPTRDELFSASTSSGAFLNDKPIKASKTRDLNKSLLASGFSNNEKREKKNLEYFLDFVHKSQSIRRMGSAALHLCYVACGRLDGYWERGLYPWDTAAGMFFVKKSGGLVTKFDGSLYSPYDKEILASNGLIHEQMKEILKK